MIEPIKLGIHGASGKMGQALLAGSKHLANMEIVYCYSPNSANNDLEKLFSSADVVIDFSSPLATSKIIDLALHFKTKLLIGTTGLSAQDHAKMSLAAQQIAIFYAPNTSLGVNVMANVLKTVASLLSAEDFDVDIIDTHHRQKKDAPSGTALMFAEKIIQGRNIARGEGVVADQQESSIKFFSLRSGDEPAKLEVIFSGQNQSLSFKHQAHCRLAFASHALAIASWLSNKKVGLYTMEDYVLNKSQTYSTLII
jgi:4-hydroxy-tetrahydrodipicolinate reductase